MTSAQAQPGTPTHTQVLGDVKFSKLTPRSHIPPHCGPSNSRIRLHLGIQADDASVLRVGNETRRWEVGKCLIFDDSYEHEVWNKGESDRIVLILDFWHPEMDTDKVRSILQPAQMEAYLQTLSTGNRNAVTGVLRA